MKKPLTGSWRAVLPRWRPLCAMGLAALLALGPARANDAASVQMLAVLPPDASLLDAWLALDPRADIDWPYAFVQPRHVPGPDSARLGAELEGLAARARMTRRDALAQALEAWQREIAALPQGRAPGRYDPMWLMQHLRQVPRLSDLAALGWCQAPRWVEIWSAAGVTRLDWQPGMTTHGLLESMPAQAYRDADHAHVVTPLGEIQPLGIAAWNYQRVSLAPGSRVVVGLAMATTAAEWLDTALPRFLSTRLPGEACTTLSLSADTDTADDHAAE